MRLIDYNRSFHIHNSSIQFPTSGSARMSSVPLPSALPTTPEASRAAAQHAPPSTSRPPRAYQLATISPHAIAGLRLLYPGLRHLSSAALREALYAHRRQLALQKLQVHGHVPFTRPRALPTAADIARYCAAHDDIRWMSLEGVAAAMLFEVERAAWVEEGALVERSVMGRDVGGARNFSGLGGRGGIASGNPGLWETLREGVLQVPEPNFEPSDEEVERFKGHCKAMAEVEVRHVRSVVCYLRKRRWQRQGKWVVEGLKGAGGLNARQEGVPVWLVRDRIEELRKAGGSVTADRMNVIRIQELQRLLVVDHERRLQGVRGDARGSMLDRATQTMLEPRTRPALQAMPPVANRVEDTAGEEAEGEEGESDSDADSGMELDDDSHHSGETMLNDDYHELFEEFNEDLV
jgi:hypothetical protein